MKKKKKEKTKLSCTRCRVCVLRLLNFCCIILASKMPRSCLPAFFFFSPGVFISLQRHRGFGCCLPPALLQTPQLLTPYQWVGAFRCHISICCFSWGNLPLGLLSGISSTNHSLGISIPLCPWCRQLMGSKPLFAKPCETASRH